MKRTLSITGITFCLALLLVSCSTNDLTDQPVADQEKWEIVIDRVDGEQVGINTEIIENSKQELHITYNVGIIGSDQTHVLHGEYDKKHKSYRIRNAQGEVLYDSSQDQQRNFAECFQQAYNYVMNYCEFIPACAPLEHMVEADEYIPIFASQYAFAICWVQL